MRKALIPVSIALCLLIGWVIFIVINPSTSKQTDKSSTQAASSSKPDNPSRAGAVNSPRGDEKQLSRQEQIALWSARYEQAQGTYSAYRDETRYPFSSRPIAEAPDQVRPFDEVLSEEPMRNARGEAVKGLLLKVGQDRVHLSGTDTVKFTIQAVDDNGKVLPLVISRATAESLPEGAALTQLKSADLTFSDLGASGGNAADTTANDGIYSARFSPATQGFTGFNGTIRTVINVRADGKEGVASIDVIYSEGIPATWGGIREVNEQGSLNFYLKADIARAGRYSVSARVDEASGKPFAILRFNDEVAAGQQEFKLQLYGLLVRDKRPTFPLKLRDISGYLLLANVFPDRLMMARRSGLVYTSRSYSLDNFSPDEWSDEQRSRYLTEYGNDIDRARKELELLGYK